MTKSRRGKFYIDDSYWGPNAGSVEYGYRVPFSKIQTFIGVVGESAAGLEDIPGVETTRHAKPSQARPGPPQAGRKHVFVGFTQGVALSENSLSGDDTLIQSDGESSTGETESIHPLYDGRLGYTDEVLPEVLEPPHFAAVYMAGRKDPVRDPANPMAGQNNVLDGSGGAGATADGSQKLGYRRSRT
jgi:hypothetical protein